MLHTCIIPNKLHHFLPEVSVFSWNYSEAGHTKGAPDGIGGTLKQGADQIVAQGKDVKNFKSLLTALRKNSPSVNIFEVKQEEITQMEILTKGSEEDKPFPGSLKVRQVIFNSL